MILQPNRQQFTTPLMYVVAKKRVRRKARLWDGWGIISSREGGISLNLKDRGKMESLGIDRSREFVVRGFLLPNCI